MPYTRSLFALRSKIINFEFMVVCDLTMLCFITVAASAQTPPTRPELSTLPGHVAPALSRATPLPLNPAAADQEIVVTLVLRRTDEAGFASFVTAVNNPASSLYQHFLGQGRSASVSDHRRRRTRWCTAI